MRLTIVIFCCFVLPLFCAQEIHFPNDFDRAANVTQVLADLRGTNVYENLVDNIISGGVLKLTLAMNRAVLSNSGSSQGNDNLVYSPVSVAGTCSITIYLQLHVRGWAIVHYMHAE